VTITPWRPSRATTLILGIASIWPIIYMGLFFGFIGYFFVAASQGNNASEFPATFKYLFLLHLLTILLMFTLIAVYVIHAYRTDLIENERRVLWVVILFFGNMIAFPIYWYLYLWRPLTKSPSP